MSKTKSKVTRKVSICLAAHKLLLVAVFGIVRFFLTLEFNPKGGIMKQYQIASTYTLSHIIDEDNNSICGTRFNAVAPIKKLKKQFRNYNEWRETSEYIINQSVENQNVSCLKCIAKAKKLWAGC